MQTRAEYEQQLERALGEAALDTAPTAQLAGFLQLLERWNQTHNLTAVRDPEHMIQRHVVESLAAAPWLVGESCCDAGSGAGLPGIPLALAEPGRRFVLVERSAKKAAFLNHVVAALRLGNVEIVAQDLKDFRPARGFATVMARALAPLPRLVPLVAHLMEPGGRLVALKGPAVEQELEELSVGYRLVEMATLPLGGRDSRVVVITGATAADGGGELPA